MIREKHLFIFKFFHTIQLRIDQIQITKLNQDIKIE